MAKESLLTKVEGRSPNWNTVIRGVITAAVIVVSLVLAARGLEAGEEWEAVLLIVVGYYFKDRPMESLHLQSRLDATAEPTRSQLQFEIVVQFVLAMVLIIGTLCAFLITDDAAVAGSWIAAVVLAVGFYFKEADSAALHSHGLYRTIIALAVALMTIFFLTPLYSPDPEVAVPLQWVALVVVVVAFYFKDRAAYAPRKEQ